MEQDQTEGYNKEYLQRVYQSLLKTGNNISLAELNTAETPLDSTSQSNVLSVANQSQIRQTVKIIQSNGTPRGEASKGGQSSSSSGHPGVVSLLHKKHGKESSIMGYRKKQPSSHRGRKHPGAVGRDPYYHKWKYLKKYVKNMIFMNAAICDEVVRQEEKVARAREERRFLLRKFLHYQTATETQSLTGKISATSILKSPGGEELLAGGGKSKAKKKSTAQTGDKAKQTRDMLESLGVKSKPKKSKIAGGKHIVPPIPLDNAGRPMFPLVLGDLTLYSIGEIVPDRPGFHTSNSIFPVGYCSTRVYANIQNPDRQCLYTCKITDGGNGPMFEIVPEDDTKTFKSRFLSECHSQLLRALNQSRGMKLVESTGKGPDFFGLSHPVVQNLIQSCPGAKKCNGYKWVKFEVNKNLTMESMPVMSEDPTISHMALKLKIAGVLEQSPSNLRTLLSGSVIDSSLLNT
ncbi:transforming growth factor beta regulator 1-like [Mercenaria mercenaria]|uniref:transforming growth factor beta regulator 1-like n=1 Tax=Mercenaria mercenaria TaxID=6596 RepID=UPI001E1D2D0E|nr:transforming growth factor beta regulator 1-like [Mercenaria mercenaria]